MKICCCPSDSDEARTAVKADVHAAVLFSFQAGVAHQGQFGAIDNEMDTGAFGHGDHQAVEGDLVAGNLSKPAVEIISFETAGIFKGGVAKDHQGDGFAGQRPGQVADHFEDCDAPFIQGGIEDRGGNALDLVDTDDISGAENCWALPGINRALTVLLP